MCGSSEGTERLEDRAGQRMEIYVCVWRSKAQTFMEEKAGFQSKKHENQLETCICCI